jgi:hypothetical protein
MDRCLVQGPHKAKAVMARALPAATVDRLVRVEIDDEGVPARLEVLVVQTHHNKSVVYEG